MPKLAVFGHIVIKSGADEHVVSSYLRIYNITI